LRLLILGLDGLDYDLVTRWELKIFMQRVFGKHYIGDLRDLYTPIIWSCFLTGLNVEKHGYDLESLKRKRNIDAFKNKYLRALYLIRRKLPIKKLGIRSLLVRFNLVEK